MVVKRKMTNAKILVVEDEKITAEHIKLGLESANYEVVGLVTSGESAIKMVEEQSVDLVLMDIHLKGEMDGIDTAEEIRERFGIPVIFLTAYSDENTVQRAKITEPSGYILKESFGIIKKPFVESELHTAIEITLYRHRTEKRLRENQRWLAAVLNSINDAVIATDSLRQVKFMNPVAEELTGWIEEDAIGMDLGEVFKILGVKNVSKDVSLEQDVLPLDHVMLILQDGTQTQINGNVTPIKDEMGNIEGLVVIFRPLES
jgi:PAS domain S-box-containing protein